ncbi:hypothetical protein DFP72DRAFT_1083330 [Ephemerocybe angulata]|uniref:Uncharacterized protein n=1 Tax=Ephemerocybe angulata TaxID=980116 RepID=A0A8H6H724_9AGAR|nr:hypothetical protein DFP72DRAFT_1083330 [Tulosesus angulatus]
MRSLVYVAVFSLVMAFGGFAVALPSPAVGTGKKRQNPSPPATATQESEPILDTDIDVIGFRPPF